MFKITDLLKPIKDAIEDYANAHCIDYELFITYFPKANAMILTDKEGDNEVTL